MKKIGFTIVEVLLVLSVIGIVAAMTIPTFVTNNRNQAMATKLSTIVEALETSFSNMMVNEYVDDFGETKFFQSFYTSPKSQDAADLFSRYYKTTSIPESMTDYYDREKPFKNIGEKFFDLNQGDLDVVYKAQNGAIIGLKKLADDKEISEEKAATEGLSVTKAYMGVVIDVNGSDKPNVHGRDAFYFIVCNDGSLHSYGTAVIGVILFDAAGYNYLYTNSSSRFACTDSVKTVGCTARLIDNSYKVDY